MKWLYRLSAIGLVLAGSVVVIQDIPSLVRGGSGANVPFPDFTGLGALMGFGVLLPGVLNLLNDFYGSHAVGLRRATIAINISMTLLFIRLATLDWVLGWFLLLPVLFAVLSAVSVIQASAARRELDTGAE